MSGLPVPAEWTARVKAFRDADTASPAATPTLLAELQRSKAGSAPILFAADDGQQYWVKFPRNPQGTQTLVAETIVAEIAPLIGAPARQTCRVNTPEAFAGIAYGPNGLHRIPQGLAHGSLLIPQATERLGDLVYAKRDDNRRRIPRLIALWDWAMGEDEQWLYDDAAHSTIWSFDHGFWLNASEGEWTPHSIRAVTYQPWPLSLVIPAGLSAEEFMTVADELEAVTEEEIAFAVSRVPRAWEPDDVLRGTLGAMLYARRIGAAERARTHGARIAKGVRS